jgi:hypothetical protein
MGLLEVVAQDLLELDRPVAVAVHPIRPRHEALVERRAGALQHSLVGGLAHEHVGEAIVGAPTRGRHARLDEMLPAKRGDDPLQLRCDLARDELLQRVLGKDEPRDGGRLDDGALLRPQEIQTGREKRLDRRRHRDLLDTSRRHPPPVLLPEDAFVDHHREHLLDEERVPLGGLDDAGSGAGVQLRRPEEVLRHPRGVARRERLERQGGGSVQLLPGGSDVEELVAGEADEQDGPLRRPEHVLDEVEQGGFRPVDVLEDDDEGSGGRHGLEQLADAPESLLDRELVPREADGRRDAPLDRLVLGEGGDLLARHLGWIVLEDPGGGSHDLDDGPERDATAVRETAPPDDRGGPAHADQKLVDQARLAHAGAAEDGREPAAVVGSRL